MAHAPEQGAVVAPLCIVEQGHQRLPIERIVRMRHGAAQLQHGGRPVHGHAGLLAHATRGNAARPMRHPRHANAAFGEIHLAAHQRPAVGEALATVVAGEHYQRVLKQAIRTQAAHDAANALVHVVNHAAVAVDVAAVQVVDRLLVLDQLARQGLVVPRFPGPVWRGVVHAQKERLIASRTGLHAVDEVHRVVGNQIGEVALLLLFLFAQP